MANPSPVRPKIGPGLRLAIDIGPLAVFFLVNFLMRGPDIVKLLAGTAAFMVASAIAMILSRWKAGHISPMLWMTGTLVLVFGGLTLWYHDKTFIQFKPTFIYAMFASILAFGLATGRPLLQMMLEAAYPGLTEKGWRQLTINWTIFFVFMAVLNEIVRRKASYDFWVAFKLWGAIPMTLLFAFANLPMLLKNGLNTDGTLPEVPPEG
ncbi:septation protein A [Sphingomonas oligophenolica]|uniref:Inner membrane-spanning protein YciB n=1 Tax=Sphingomonas oligophenolica TaxID=301154 RepID=A0ABU9XXV2_9SPHN